MCLDCAADDGDFRHFRHTQERIFVPFRSIHLSGWLGGRHSLAGLVETANGHLFGLVCLLPLWAAAFGQRRANCGRPARLLRGPATTLGVINLAQSGRAGDSSQANLMDSMGPQLVVFPVLSCAQKGRLEKAARTNNPRRPPTQRRGRKLIWAHEVPGRGANMSQRGSIDCRAELSQSSGRRCCCCRWR